MPEKRSYARAATHTLRIVAGVLVIALLLHLASRLTRDCTVGLYLFDLCSWVWVREQLGLPANKFLRAGFLEISGITLAAGIYLTLRWVFPFRRAGKSAEMDRRQGG